ncbi:MAG: SpoVR family protein [Parcubacteria group bacterium]|nr:SpoVR family protein [Parcubacteria group bacterium]
MPKPLDIERLKKIEKRIHEIAQEWGFLTTDIQFEIVGAQKMLEGMAYMFPVNFSHWSFGRDYEMHRTVYDHTGSGIPYETVWNFTPPVALLVETNPFALNTIIIGHVYAHVDFFLASKFLQLGRFFSDIADETYYAAERFREYEVQYGKDEVEKTIDAGMAIWWQQHPDLFFEEELDEDIARDRLLTTEREKARPGKDVASQFKQGGLEDEVLRRKLRFLAERVPPEPIYDLLGYIARYSPLLKSWQKDILSVMRNQARSLAPQRKTKLLNEGWATYWHVRFMRRLFEEGLLTAEEHGIYNDFHAGVTRENKVGFNWYRIGLALFEYIEEKYNKGRFGREYEACEDPVKKAYWDTHAMKGREKIFHVRSFYSDRMAIEEFFTDEFIHQMQLYIWEAYVDEKSGETTYYIAEKDPAVIRRMLTRSHTLYGIEPIVIQNANHNRSGHLYLNHLNTDVELDPKRRDGTLFHIFTLWGKPVSLETNIDDKRVVCSFDGKKPEVKPKPKI